MAGDVLVRPTNNVGALGVITEGVVTSRILLARFTWDARVV
jgi:hypothetical protein